MGTDNYRMRTDFYTKCILTLIAMLLAILALRSPMPVEAQSQRGHDLWIEPGFVAVRKPDGSMQTEGKMVIDHATGDIWGYPTGTTAPYPIDTTSSTPPVSKPVYLGKFDFSAMSAARK